MVNFRWKAKKKKKMKEKKNEEIEYVQVENLFRLDRDPLSDCFITIFFFFLITIQVQ